MGGMACGTSTMGPGAGPPTPSLPLPGSSPQIMAGFPVNPPSSHSDTMVAGDCGGVQGVNAGFGDVMVVGEPTLMGGEFGDEDERVITRLENGGQIDMGAASGINQVGAGGGSGMNPVGGGGGGGASSLMGGGSGCLGGVGVPGGDGASAGLACGLGGVGGVGGGGGSSILPPLMGPASLLSEQHPNLCIEHDIKDPKLKSGLFYNLLHNHLFHYY